MVEAKIRKVVPESVKKDETVKIENCFGVQLNVFFTNFFLFFKLFRAFTANRAFVSDDPNYKPKIVWHMVIFCLYLHYAAYCGLCAETSLSSKILQFFFFFISAIGITSGAHQLFSHRSFTANKKLC